MRRVAIALSCLGALVLLLAGLGSGTAVAGSKKMVEGTVYDTTCPGTTCGGCPPPCGPVPVPQKRNSAICAGASIVCPLASAKRPAASPDFCIQGEPCGVSFPIYSGEGSLVNVRKRGSAKVIARLPIVEGHFRIRLAPGEYVFHPYMAEENCWSAETMITAVMANVKSPIAVTMNATDGCVVHPDVK
jgi:hypothetical protein